MSKIKFTKLAFLAISLMFFQSCVTDDKNVENESVNEDVFPENFLESKLEYRTSGFICDDSKMPTDFILNGVFTKPIKITDYYTFSNSRWINESTDSTYIVLSPDGNIVYKTPSGTENVVSYEFVDVDRGMGLSYTYSAGKSKFSKSINFCETFFTDVQIRESGIYFEIDRNDEKTKFCIDGVVNELYLSKSLKQFGDSLSVKIKNKIDQDVNEIYLKSDIEMNISNNGDTLYTIGRYIKDGRYHNIESYRVIFRTSIEITDLFTGGTEEIDLCESEETSSEIRTDIRFLAVQLR